VSLASALVAIAALCVVIILHELGHYLAAVWTGMRVDRFSVFGIGPPILKLGKWRGTEIVISAIPFGAYVQIRGMEADDGSSTERDPQAFREKPLRSRMLVIAGGPIANYVAAMVMFFGVYTAIGVPAGVEAIEVANVTPDSAAEHAGIQPGDRLLAIGDVVIDPDQLGQDVSLATQSQRGHSIDVVVARADQSVTLHADLPAEGDAPLGIMSRRITRYAPVSIGTSALAAIKTPLIISGEQLTGLWMLATGQLKGSVQGPVAIVQSIATEVELGIVPFVLQAAFISTLLGLFNLLPLPALDGGRLAFLAYEGLARRRASARIEEAVHGYGMLALLLLIAVVTIGDVRRLL
jgi:regulator of sigma E protease